MVRLELGREAALGQLLLQIAVELERVVLRHYNAYLLVFSGEIPQYAFSHSFKPAEDEAVGNNDAGYERLEAATDVEVTQFELHAPSRQIYRRQTRLGIALPRVVIARWTARLCGFDHHAWRRSRIFPQFRLR